MSAASEPLNFFIIVKYDLWPTYSFSFFYMTAPLLTKYVIKLAKNLNFYAS